MPVAAELAAQHIDQRRTLTQRYAQKDRVARFGAAVLEMQLERLFAARFNRSDRILRAHDEIAAPLTQLGGQLVRRSVAADDAQTLSAHFPRVAIRTDENALAPFIGKARNIGQRIVD